MTANAAAVHPKINDNDKPDIYGVKLQEKENKNRPQR